MINLYHTTTKPGLNIVVPKTINHFGYKFPHPVVWAVEKKSLPLFLFPQNCPRISYQIGSETTNDEKIRFKKESLAKQIIIIESKWFEILQNQPIYKYELAPNNFSLMDKTMGLHTSDKNTPVSIQKLITNPLSELLNLDIELRITPSLWKLFDYLSNSSYQTFFINLKNANPRMIFE